MPQRSDPDPVKNGIQFERPEDRKNLTNLIRTIEELSSSARGIQKVLDGGNGWLALRAAWEDTPKNANAIGASIEWIKEMDAQISREADREFLELDASLREAFSKL